MCSSNAMQLLHAYNAIHACTQHGHTTHVRNPRNARNACRYYSAASGREIELVMGGEMSWSGPLEEFEATADGGFVRVHT